MSPDHSVDLEAPFQLADSTSLHLSTQVGAPIDLCDNYTKESSCADADLLSCSSKIDSESINHLDNLSVGLLNSLTTVSIVVMGDLSDLLEPSPQSPNKVQVPLIMSNSSHKQLVGENNAIVENFMIDTEEEVMCTNLNDTLLSIVPDHLKSNESDQQDSLENHTHVPNCHPEFLKSACLLNSCVESGSDLPSGATNMSTISSMETSADFIIAETEITQSYTKVSLSKSAETIPPPGLLETTPTTVKILDSIVPNQLWGSKLEWGLSCSCPLLPRKREDINQVANASVQIRLSGSDYCRFNNHLSEQLGDISIKSHSKSIDSHIRNAANSDYPSISRHDLPLTVPGNESNGYNINNSIQLTKAMNINDVPHTLGSSQSQVTAAFPESSQGEHATQSSPHSIFESSAQKISSLYSAKFSSVPSMGFGKVELENSRKKGGLECDDLLMSDNRVEIPETIEKYSTELTHLPQKTKTNFGTVKLGRVDILEHDGLQVAQALFSHNTLIPVSTSHPASLELRSICDTKLPVKCIRKTAEEHEKGPIVHHKMLITDLAVHQTNAPKQSHGTRQSHIPVIRNRPYTLQMTTKADINIPIQLSATLDSVVQFNVDTSEAGAVHSNRDNTMHKVLNLPNIVSAPTSPNQKTESGLEIKPGKDKGVFSKVQPKVQQSLDLVHKISLSGIGTMDTAKPNSPKTRLIQKKSASRQIRHTTSSTVNSGNNTIFPNGSTMLFTKNGLYTRDPSRAWDRSKTPLVPDGRNTTLVNGYQSPTQIAVGPCLPALEMRPMSRKLKQRFHKGILVDRDQDSAFSPYSQPLPLTRDIPVIQKNLDKRPRLIRELKTRWDLRLQELHIGSTSLGLVRKMCGDSFGVRWSPEMKSDVGSYTSPPTVTEPHIAQDIRHDLSRSNQSDNVKKVPMIWLPFVDTSRHAHNDFGHQGSPQCEAGASDTMQQLAKVDVQIPDGGAYPSVHSEYDGFSTYNRQGEHALPIYTNNHPRQVNNGLLQQCHQHTVPRIPPSMHIKIPTGGSRQMAKGIKAVKNHATQDQRGVSDIRLDMKAYHVINKQ
ncbi:hypothetical protein BSLG_006467 [Batrachochytrium salamandrivorans]|nr:hypothetical protein BSLG_006467 [Batrachochytrium salamandrivorans]